MTTTYRPNAAEREPSRISRRKEINKPVIGKNARKRLAREFVADLETFEERWQKELTHYLGAIHSRASDGVRLRDHQDRKTPSVFRLVDEAMQTLAQIGEDALRHYGPNTFDVLSAEYVRVFGSQITPQLRRYKAHRWCV